MYRFAVVPQRKYVILPPVVLVYKPLFSTSFCPFPQDFPLYKGTRKGQWLWWGIVLWPCTYTSPDLCVANSHIFKFLKEAWFAFLFFSFLSPHFSLKGGKNPKQSLAYRLNIQEHENKAQNYKDSASSPAPEKKEHNGIVVVIVSRLGSKGTVFMLLKYFYTLLILYNW